MNNTLNNAIILTNGLLTTSDAKTAHGLIRGSERFNILGVIDPPAAGQDAGILLDGLHRNIPVFDSLETALAQIGQLDSLIIGVATVGGVLPVEMLDIIRSAIRCGLSVVNGLHDYLTEKPELLALAQTYQVQLTDIRKPKPRQNLHFWTGAIYDVPCPIIAVIGTDCAVGKRTTARMLRQCCAAAGIHAQMIYTGQTGWLQGGQYGFIFDSTLNDFVSGELEHAILSCWKEMQPDLILLEGQSALRNPSGPCGPELLISGHAKQVILVHAPKRRYFDNEAHWGEIPPVESEIALIRQYGSAVLALALNTEGCTAAEALAYQEHYSSLLGIPVLLPLEQGLESLLPAIKALFP